MSVFAKLAAMMTAADLQEPLSIAIPEEMPIKDSIAHFTENEQTRSDQRENPTLRPWCQPPGDFPHRCSLVVRGVHAIGVIDPTSAAQELAQAWSVNPMLMVSGEYDKPAGLRAIPLQEVTVVCGEASVFDVLDRLAEPERTFVLVSDGENYTGFITIRFLQKPAFTLPLFGLLLQLEETALQAIEIDPEVSLQVLPANRLENAKKGASNYWAKLIRQTDGKGLSLPVEVAFQLSLMPEDTSQRLAAKLKQYGSPPEMILQFTTFCDKCTVLWKRKIIQWRSRNSLEDSWGKAERVRNAIAHGRAWWDELPTASDILEFVADVQSLLQQLQTAIQKGKEPPTEEITDEVKDAVLQTFVETLLNNLEKADERAAIEAEHGEEVAHEEK